LYHQYQAESDGKEEKAWVGEEKNLWNEQQRLKKNSAGDEAGENNNHIVHMGGSR
jgi:hypothetical protein